MRQSNSVTGTDAGRVFFSASENTGHSDGSCKCPPAVVMREALQRTKNETGPLAPAIRPPICLANCCNSPASVRTAVIAWLWP
jgi:hypothetical protein